MTLSLADAKHIIGSRKRLVNIHPWVLRPTRDGKAVQCTFEARIEIDGTLPRGVWFRSTLWPKNPDTASIQLECDLAGSRSHMPLYRLDWRPMTTHTNGQFGPPELRGAFFDVGDTHEHICFDHAVEELCWIFGDGVNQAADFFSDATSIPSRNVTPLTTFGN